MPSRHWTRLAQIMRIPIVHDEPPSGEKRRHHVCLSVSTSALAGTRTRSLHVAQVHCTTEGKGEQTLLSSEKRPNEKM